MPSLGPFDLLDPLASGGMGTVWRAVHRRTGTPVAVKVVAPDALPTAKSRALFAQEVRAVARLTHPNIAWPTPGRRSGRS